MFRILMLIACMCPFASAGLVVYDNGAGPANTFNVGSVSDPSFKGPTGTGQGLLRVDDASLPTATTIVGINWTGTYQLEQILATPAPATDNFTISFWQDIGGSPAVGLPLASISVGNAVNRTDTGIDFLPGYNIFEYSADLGAGFDFDAGVTYWVGVANDTAADPTLHWLHTGISPGGNSYSAMGPGVTSWEAQTNVTDFRLVAVPEPNAFLLVGLSILVLVWRRKYRAFSFLS